MNIKKKTIYNIVFWAFMLFVFGCIAYTIVDVVRCFI